MAEFEFMVDGLFKSTEIIATGWPTKIISLIDKTDGRFLDHAGDHHLIRYFDDIETNSTREWKAPDIDDVTAILAHSADLNPDDKILVHCRAGKSRSTATMIAILIQHGVEPQEAFDRVAAHRPVLIPNRRLIELYDAALDLTGRLNEVIGAYYQRLTLPGITLPNRGGHNL